MTQTEFLNNALELYRKLKSQGVDVLGLSATGKQTESIDVTFTTGSVPNYKTQECTRHQPHDGPCNGTPCEPRKQLLLEEKKDAATSV